MPIAALGVVAIFAACSNDTETKTPSLCTPGAYVFCRCQDRQEGTKLCQDDAQSFGPCEPCPGDSKPRGPIDPGDPGPPRNDPDAGDAPDPPATCGDGVVDEGEDCDDANTNDTDGCDATCKLAGAAPAATNACPGLEVHVWGGAHRPSLSSTTVGAGNRSLTPSCSNGTPTSGAAGNDRVFQVVAHATGTLSVATTDADYNVLLYASETCSGTTIAPLSCVNEIDGEGDELLSFPVDAGNTYFVFVDGALPSSLDAKLLEGHFRVTFSIR